MASLLGWGWEILTSYLPETTESYLSPQQSPLLLSIAAMMEINSKGVLSSFGGLVYKMEEPSL